MTNLPGRRQLAAAIVVFAALIVVPSPPASAAQRGSVYLMRGFANVFSLGMDALNDKLKARGVNSHVLGDADWLTISREIEARYAKEKSALPVIVMGHSLGANATELVAAELATHHIPVALIVNFDATSPPLTGLSGTSPPRLSAAVAVPGVGTEVQAQSPTLAATARAAASTRFIAVFSPSSPSRLAGLS